MKRQIIVIGYVLFAGVAFSWISYFISFKLLALIEDTQFIQIGSFLTILSPVIGPAIGSILFFRFVSSHLIPSNLWKQTLCYSILLIVLLEVYLLQTDPMWSGLGFMVAGLSGIILSLIAYKKARLPK